MRLSAILFCLLSALSALANPCVEALWWLPYNRIRLWLMATVWLPRKALMELQLLFVAPLL